MEIDFGARPIWRPGRAGSRKRKQLDKKKDAFVLCALVQLRNHLKDAIERMRFFFVVCSSAGVLSFGRANKFGHVSGRQVRAAASRAEAQNLKIECPWRARLVLN